MNASEAKNYGATEAPPAPAAKKWGRRDAVAAVLILASTAAAAAYVSGSGTGLRGAAKLDVFLPTGEMPSHVGPPGAAQMPSIESLPSLVNGPPGAAKIPFIPYAGCEICKSNTCSTCALLKSQEGPPVFEDCEDEDYSTEEECLAGYGVFCETCKYPDFHNAPDACPICEIGPQCGGKTTPCALLEPGTTPPELEGCADAEEGGTKELCVGGYGVWCPDCTYPDPNWQPTPDCPICETGPQCGGKPTPCALLEPGTTPPELEGCADAEEGGTKELCVGGYGVWCPTCTYPDPNWQPTPDCDICVSNSCSTCALLDEPGEGPPAFESCEDEDHSTEKSCLNSYGVFCETCKYPDPNWQPAVSYSYSSYSYSYDLCVDGFNKEKDHPDGGTPCVVCGENEANFCDCAGDCYASEESYCDCPEAQACCGN